MLPEEGFSTTAVEQLMVEPMRALSIVTEKLQIFPSKLKLNIADAVFEIDTKGLEFQKL